MSQSKINSFCLLYRMTRCEQGGQLCIKYSAVKIASWVLGAELGFASREFPPGKFPGNPKFSFPVSREIFLVISREIREILSNIYSRNMGNFNEFSSILTKRNTYFYILVVKVHHSRSIFHEYFESRFFIWIGLHWYHQRLCYLSTSQIKNSYMTIDKLTV